MTDAQIEAFLDEALPADKMAAIEEELRKNDELTERVAAVVGRRDAGLHTVGAVWRRRRLTCPTREQLGSFLLNVLDASTADYIRFHVETIGCRICSASLADLKEQHAADDEATSVRRRKYFQSSAGYLGDD